ncbi:hypothetical protein K438DRAFT_1998251 [Mycena galopus ATCC 62051]|nr:hypothetical protein K438DRAFT_1998251 [Mycena galopus ATCC 62051]
MSSALAPEGADNAANNSETPASRSPSRRLFGDQDMSAAGHAATTSAPASDPPGATPHRGTSPENVPPDPLNSPENPLLDPVTSRTTTDSSGPHPTTSGILRYTSVHIPITSGHHPVNPRSTPGLRRFTSGSIPDDIWTTTG